jgi:hypothetical protein
MKSAEARIERDLNSHYLISRSPGKSLDTILQLLPHYNSLNILFHNAYRSKV